MVKRRSCFLSVLNLLQRSETLRFFATPALAIAMILGVGQPAQAQTRDVDLAFFYQNDLRALAMGNAFGAVARGESALLYNPAGLVQYKDDIAIQASVALEAEAGPFLDDTQKQLTGSPSATAIQNYLTKYLGQRMFYRGQTFYNAVANLGAINLGLGAGMLNQQRYRFEFKDAIANGTFDTNDELVLAMEQLDMAMYAFGVRLMQGKLLLGATYKDFTYKEENNGSPTFQTIITSGKVDTSLAGPTYKGKDYDLGMIYRVEWLPFLRPQWSLTALNVGAGKLRSSDPTAEVLRIPTSYNMGIAFNPSLSWAPVKLLFSAEYEDVTGAIKVTDPVTGLPAKRSTTQRLHYGAELGFWELPTGNHVLNARVGANRGLLSYGFEINLWYGLRLLYTHYKDNLGSAANKDIHTFQAAQVGIGFAW